MAAKTKLKNPIVILTAPGRRFVQGIARAIEAVAFSVIIGLFMLSTQHVTSRFCKGPK